MTRRRDWLLVERAWAWYTRRLVRLARRDDDHAADLQIQRLTLLSADVNRREAGGEQPVPQLREGEKANREVDGADAAAADDEAVRLGPRRRGPAIARVRQCSGMSPDTPREAEHVRAHRGHVLGEPGSTKYALALFRPPREPSPWSLHAE